MTASHSVAYILNEYFQAALEIRNQVETNIFLTVVWDLMEEILS